MGTRVIEILTNGTKTSKDRGFMRVENQSAKVDIKIPLDDIAVLILGHGTTTSTNLISALNSYGAIIVITGSNYHPASYIWPQPEGGMYLKRLTQQIESTQPFRKRVWQKIVQFKIQQQAHVLNYFNINNTQLSSLEPRVRSGDPDNIEAQAARRYWSSLFGKQFRRDANAIYEPKINLLLNYGYTVIRASTARSIASAALTPALGVHHHNLENPFCLVDDLMEPYRPLVDHHVATLKQKGAVLELNPENKKLLAGLLEINLVNYQGSNSPVSITMHHVAASYCKSLENGKPDIHYPASVLPSDQLV